MTISEAKAKIMTDSQAKSIIEKAASMVDGSVESARKAVAWATEHVRRLMPDVAHVVLVAAIVLLIVQLLGVAVVTIKTFMLVLAPIVGIVVAAYILHELLGLLLLKNAAETPAPAPAA